jgi:transposase-like protein
MKTTIDEIRTALVRSDEGVGRPYPAHLRAAVLAHAEQRRRAGVSLEAFAAEIGLATTTLRKWMRNALAAAHPAFCEVEIVPAPAPPSALVVHGPAGLRIEGATIADVAELVRRLA